MGKKGISQKPIETLVATDPVENSATVAAARVSARAVVESAQIGSKTASKTSLITVVITLVGVIFSTMLLFGGNVITSAFNNWDKFQNSAKSDNTDESKTVEAYNQQRENEIVDSFDSLVTKLQEAKSEITQKGIEPSNEDSQLIDNTVILIQERKSAVQNQYKKMYGEIRDHKPVQADITKTAIGTLLNKTQQEANKELLKTNQAILRGEKVTFPPVANRILTESAESVLSCDPTSLFLDNVCKDVREGSFTIVFLSNKTPLIREIQAPKKTQGACK